MLKTKKERLLLLLTCIVYASNAVFTILTTDRIAAVIACAEKGEKDSLLSMILLAIIIVVFEKITSVGMAFCAQRYLTESDLLTKKSLMRSILRRPIPVFRKQEDGYYINLFTTDVMMHRENALGSYPWLAFFSVFGILAVVMLARINIILALITLILSATPMLSEKILAKYVEKKKEIYSKESGKNLQIIKENLEGFESIKQDNSISAFEKRYDVMAKSLRSAAAANAIAGHLSQEALYIAASALRLTALAIGAYMSIRGKFSAAFLFAVIDYATSLSNSISNLSYYSISIKSTKKITERLRKEIAVCPESDLSYEVNPVSCTALGIQYKNFTFSYDSKKLFDNFSYTFNPGKCYAITGESGRGKTTLIRALLKYFDNYSGEVLIDGIDIKTMSDTAVFTRVAYVNQERWIINAPLYENITMLSETPAENSVEYNNLLQMLQLASFADKAGTRPLGDVGGAVSGGEIQRICIARALRRHTGVLILDEPTTGLDPENAKIIDDFIFNLKGITRIIITHNWNDEYLNRFDGVVKLT